MEESHLSLTRAAARTDHPHAVVIRFGADESTTERLRAKVHSTGQHGSALHSFLARHERLAPASPGTSA